MYKIPINLMLKDNADDIKEKILSYHVHPVTQKIIEQCGNLIERYTGSNTISAPEKVTYEELAQQVQTVFIALHGRPCEDGQ